MCLAGLDFNCWRPRAELWSCAIRRWTGSLGLVISEMCGCQPRPNNHIQNIFPLLFLPLLSVFSFPYLNVSHGMRYLLGHAA